MDGNCRIELLGCLRVTQEDRVFSRFRTYKTGVLLAYLAFYGKRAHLREELTELLWPDCEPEAARNNLSRALCSLRHQLEPPGVSPGTVIMADRASVRLSPAAYRTDVAEFEAACSAAEGVSGLESLPLLAEAVELYGGELLPGYYEDWNLAERERLLQLYLRTLRRGVSQFLRAGNLDRALHFAHRAVQADPFSEQAYVELIRLCGAAGDIVAARRHYQALERMLATEFGSAPSSDLQAEVQRLLSQRPGLPPDSGGTSIPRLLRPALSGTVTFLVLQGSPDPDAASVRDLFGRHGGQLLEGQTVAQAAIFSRASDAVAAATAAQALPAGATGPPRIALHTGEASAEGASEDLLSDALSLLLATNPGQILCTEATAALTASHLPPESVLVELGPFRLRGAATSRRLFALEASRSATGAVQRPNAEPGTRPCLPVPMTRFFGREGEIRSLLEMLAPCREAPGSEREAWDAPDGASERHARLVTLTGPGGCGKTRLALEMAHRIATSLDGRVWFVSLVDLRVATELPKALVTALGLPPSTAVEPLPQAVQALARPAGAGRSTALLIFDNMEHLLSGGGDREVCRILEDLVGQLPGLRCLVTSRRRLGMAGERDFPVPPLAVPVGSAPARTPEQLLLYESVRLFLDRAQAVRADFQIVPSNLAAVAAVCERMEGIPLALELAAARVQVLTPAQILERLEHRLPLLVGRKTAAHERHHTLRSAIEWSYRLLTPELQRFFARLSVFRGGWTLEAAEAVCGDDSETGRMGEGENGRRGELGSSLSPILPFPLSPLPQHDVLDSLAELCECSLLLREEGGGATSPMRFRMLETLREYAEEQLAPEEIAGRRQLHADFFAGLAEAASAHLSGPEALHWLDHLDAEHDNLRLALEWCHDHDAGRELCVAAALWRFWDIRGHRREGWEYLRRTLPPAEGADAAVRIEALIGAAVLVCRLGNCVEAGSLLQQSLALARDKNDRRGAARTLHRLGWVTAVRGDHDAAPLLFEESLAIAREAGERAEIAQALQGLAVVIRYSNVALGRTLLEECLALRRELGDRLGEAAALMGLGNAARREGDLRKAETLYHRSLAIWREAGDKASLPGALINLGFLASDREDWSSAYQYYSESLQIWSDMADSGGVIAALEALAQLAVSMGRPEQAARLFGATATLGEAMAASLPRPDQVTHDQCVAAVRELIGEEGYAAAWAEGRRMSFAEAVACGLEVFPT